MQLLLITSTGQERRRQEVVWHVCLLPLALPRRLRADISLSHVTLCSTTYSIMVYAVPSDSGSVCVRCARPCRVLFDPIQVVYTARCGTCRSTPRHLSVPRGFSTRYPRVPLIGLAPSPSFHHLRPTEAASLLLPRRRPGWTRYINHRCGEFLPIPIPMFSVGHPYCCYCWRWLLLLLLLLRERLRRPFCAVFEHI